MQNGAEVCRTAAGGVVVVCSSAGLRLFCLWGVQTVRGAAVLLAVVCSTAGGRTGCGVSVCITSAGLVSVCAIRPLFLRVLLLFSA